MEELRLQYLNGVLPFQVKCLSLNLQMLWGDLSMKNSVLFLFHQESRLSAVSFALF